MTSPREPKVPRLLLFGVGALLGLLCIPFVAGVHAGQGESLAGVISSEGQAADHPSEPSSDDTVRTIAASYPPPMAAEKLGSDDFGVWLQALELEPPSEPVRTYNGYEVPGDFHVIKLPLVSGDLQQCADTAIRLRAE